MKDFLKSITFQIGMMRNRDPILDVRKGPFEYDFEFISKYYNLKVKYIHGDNICRFVEEQSCEEEPIND